MAWHQVQDNFRKILNLKNSNIIFGRFSYTATPFSLYYHDIYEAWAKEFFKDTVVDPLRQFDRPWQPRGQTEMQLNAIPPNLAEVIRTKYGPGHSITKLLEPYNPSKNLEFKNYITYHDKHRGTDWKQVFPEMVEYFQSD